MSRCGGCGCHDKELFHAIANLQPSTMGWMIVGEVLKQIGFRVVLSFLANIRCIGCLIVETTVVVIAGMRLTNHIPVKKRSQRLVMSLKDQAMCSENEFLSQEGGGRNFLLDYKFFWILGSIPPLF